jgi:hypothetical protein
MVVGASREFDYHLPEFVGSRELFASTLHDLKDVQ